MDFDISLSQEKVSFFVNMNTFISLVIMNTYNDFK